MIMAVVDVSELREKTADELKDILLSTLNEQFKLRMQSSSSDQQIQPHLIKEARRNIARIKTVMTEKRISKGRPQTVAEST